MQMSYLRARQTFHSKTFAKSLNIQKEYENNVWQKSNDAYSLSIRVQTTMNHTSIFTLLCFYDNINVKENVFFQSVSWKRHCATHWREQGGWNQYRGYYTVARRYEFYVRVARTMSHEWAQRMSEIMFLPREHKIHIFEPTCNVLFIIWRNQFNKSKGGNRDVVERYDTHKGDIRKIRHSGPGWSGVWNLRVV